MHIFSLKKTSICIPLQARTMRKHFRSYARVAELVDALVSNTNDSNIVPVRSRPRVQKTPHGTMAVRGFWLLVQGLAFRC
jgi:hypothetical protein